MAGTGESDCVGEGARVQLGREFAQSCRETLDTLTAVMRNEDDHLMLHSLQSLKCELEWAASEFGGGGGR